MVSLELPSIITLFTDESIFFTAIFLPSLEATGGKVAVISPPEASANIMLCEPILSLAVIVLKTIDTSTIELSRLLIELFIVAISLL